uniref:Uncharacterized protein n=1 Tax=Arundo donax TaxID=35708 RepID=A0A0A9CDB4_ARUDO
MASIHIPRHVHAWCLIVTFVCRSQTTQTITITSLYFNLVPVRICCMLY